MVNVSQNAFLTWFLRLVISTFISTALLAWEDSSLFSAFSALISS